MTDKATEAVNMGKYFHEVWDAFMSTAMGWTPQEWVMAFITVFAVLFILKLVFNLLKTLIFVGMLGAVAILAVYLYSMEPDSRKTWIESKVHTVKCFISPQVCDDKKSP